MRPAELADRVRADHPDVVLARGEVALVVDRSELLEALDRLREDDAALERSSQERELARAG